MKLLHTLSGLGIQYGCAARSSYIERDCSLCTRLRLDRRWQSTIHDTGSYISCPEDFIDDAKAKNKTNVETKRLGVSLIVLHETGWEWSSYSPGKVFTLEEI